MNQGRKRFADGDMQIQESIRGCDVFLIQPTCAPVNDHLMELLIMVDARRRASARQITAVVPYYGYARRSQNGGTRIHHRQADREPAGPIRCGSRAGHGSALAQIQGYFDIPVTTSMGRRCWSTTSRLRTWVTSSWCHRREGWHGPGLRQADERRPGDRQTPHWPQHGREPHRDRRWAGKTAVLIDDMIDTGGTICAVPAWREQVPSVIACATHAVFSPPASERLSTEGLFEQVVVTNSIPIPQDRCSSN